MAKVLGIDLGTTNSAAAVIDAGEPVIIENAEGGRLTPSVIALNTRSGERYVGQVAKRQAVTNPENTLFSVKRLMGRKFDDSVVQGAINKLPYKIVNGTDGDAHVEMGGQSYAPAQVSSFVLQKIKQDAEAKLGETITQAVITVPAYFDDAPTPGHQRRPAPSLEWRCCASSTSPPPPHWPTGWTRQRRRPPWRCSTWAAAHSISPS